MLRPWEEVNDCCSSSGTAKGLWPRQLCHQTSTPFVHTACHASHARRGECYSILLQSFDIETGSHMELLNLNPEGWVDGVSNERNWGMMYGMDVSWHRNLILAGDSFGVMHCVDPRAHKEIVGQYQWHKKGNKVSHTFPTYIV